MPLNSEVLKHRFQNFLQKKVEVWISMQNEKYFGRFLDDFFALFFSSQKVETSYFPSPGVFAPLPCTVCLV